MARFENTDGTLITLVVVGVLAAVGAVVARGSRTEDDTFAFYTGGDAEFEVWLRQVDDRLYEVMELGVFDIRDRRWRSEWDAGASPNEAIEELVGSTDDSTAMMQEEIWG